MTNSHWRSSSSNSTYASGLPSLPLKYIEGYSEIRSLSPEIEIELVRSCTALVQLTRSTKSLADIDFSAQARSFRRTSSNVAQHNSDITRASYTRPVTAHIPKQTQRANTLRPNTGISKDAIYYPPRRPSTSTKLVISQRDDAPPSEDISPISPHSLQRKNNMASIYTHVSEVVVAYIRPTSPLPASHGSSSTSTTESPITPRRSSESRLPASSRRGTNASSAKSTIASTRPRTQGQISERPSTARSETRWSVMPRKSTPDLKTQGSLISNSAFSHSPNPAFDATKHNNQTFSLKQSSQAKTVASGLRKRFSSFFKRSKAAELQAF